MIATHDTQTLRITPDAVEAILESGRPVTMLDVRSGKAYDSSYLHIPGDIRVDPEEFRPEAAGYKDQMTVAYCT